MELVAITVYPVKSCRGIALTRARVERRGLANDRRWMVIDDAGRFVTQREEARLALVETAIVSYASKHSSVFYGPFREAAGSTPSFGDRKSYQLDPANGREAMRELELDAAEGADVLMVKPALTSLDILARARDRFDLPLAAYQVSGEAAMIEAAAERGWIDRRGAVLESLTAIVRAGADIVTTYFAADAASWLRERG